MYFFSPNCTYQGVQVRIKGENVGDTTDWQVWLIGNYNRSFTVEYGTHVIGSLCWSSCSPNKRYKSSSRTSNIPRAQIAQSTRELVSAFRHHTPVFSMKIRTSNPKAREKGKERRAQGKNIHDGAVNGVAVREENCYKTNSISHASGSLPINTTLSPVMAQDCSSYMCWLWVRSAFLVKPLPIPHLAQTICLRLIALYKSILNRKCLLSDALEWVVSTFHKLTATIRNSAAETNCRSPLSFAW